MSASTTLATARLGAPAVLVGIALVLVACGTSPWFALARPAS